LRLFSLSAVNVYLFKPNKNMSTGLQIVGSSRANGERQSDDFYPTPPYAVKELLKRESFQGVTWECACGDGAISKVLIEDGLQVESTDLVFRGYGDGGVDFLRSDKKVNNIVTNPPFKLALEFVEKAKIVSDSKIALFLKTVFLESSDRKKMFEDTIYPLRSVYQFSKRVTLYKDGIKMKNSGMIAYAWFVWDKSYKGKPMLEWI
jgi:hypothetical protein